MIGSIDLADRRLTGGTRTHVEYTVRHTGLTGTIAFVFVDRIVERVVIENVPVSDYTAAHLTQRNVIANGIIGRPLRKQKKKK